MSDLFSENMEKEDGKLQPSTVHFLNETKAKMSGSDCRKFMAAVVRLLNSGGQSLAERELGWDRSTIRKGEKELQSGFDCIDNFAARGRKPTQEHLPNIESDIKEIMEPNSQADPTFRTETLYSPLTASEVRRRLIELKKYTDDHLPTERTISTIMNNLGYHPQLVAKAKPKKKIPETNAIFDHVHRLNKLADESEGVVRVSMDAKAPVKVGPFSRGGYSRQKVEALDHDFDPETVLKLFGIHTLLTNETQFFFTESNLTADFMVDCLEEVWAKINRNNDIHTLAINLDNGPENSSSRTQFVKRMVEFGFKHKIDIELIYYPPYHSKYNFIERVWGILENHWKGQLLDSVEKVLGLARTMTYNGVEPVVHFVKGAYEKGVKVTKKAMAKYEEAIERLPGLEKWAVSIPCFPH